MAWDSSKVHQDLSGRGRYDPTSDLAKQYEATKEDGSSRVDDGEGWREVQKDSPPKTAAEYEAFVNKWSAAGFDVKAIDMDGDDFTNSNIAVKPKGESSGPKDIEVDRNNMEMSPEYAHAKARVAQFKEDELSGRTAEELFGDAPDSSNFLDRYKLKLGERLANGNYRPPKLKDVDKADPVK